VKGRGWLLEPYLKGEYAWLWLKPEEGKPRLLRERHRPRFLVETKEGVPVEVLRSILEGHPLIYSVSETPRFTDLKRSEKKIFAEVRVDSVDCLEEVIGYTRSLREVKEIYDVGLAPVQWYLMDKGVAPTSFCEFEEEEGVLKYLKTLEDDWVVEPPPFRLIRFQAPLDGLIDEVTLYDEGEQPKHFFQGSENSVLESFNAALESEDPDVMVTDNVGIVVKRMLKRAAQCGVNFRFGRDGDPLHGRIILGLSSYLDMGLAGLVERSRFTLAPMGLSYDWEAGKTIDSRQCYEAYRLEIAVPEMKGGYGFESDAWELVQKDRGGMLFSPQPGLHENVGCLDFESMFPNIIVKKNVSYETVTETEVTADIEGFLGRWTGHFLERRLSFKHLRNAYPPRSKEWRWCEERQSSLKLMLVVVYGYSGCYANRFANVRVFQEINRQARNAMVKALNISLEGGFKVVYGDTDSLFIKKLGAKRGDYENLAAAIAEKTGLPIKLDKHFRFLVLLNKSTDPQQSATRRYYGRLMEGGYFFRGIELRRHDTPPYIKRLQERVMEVLFDAEDGEDVMRRGVPRALAQVNRACEEIRQRRVEARELVISKRLTREIKEYQSLQPHIVAALLGGEEEGDSNFVFMNTERKNPYLRVIPAYMLDEASRSYDWRKYASLTRKAGENMLASLTKELEQRNSSLRMSQLDAFLL
jgi:DNA polymerase elongation subunit (family B)